MNTIIKTHLFFCAFFASIEVTITSTGVFIRPEQHTLPDGLQAVSGSDANGGCIMECVQTDRCQCPDGIQINSTLVDGVCPTSVDTTDLEYASDFFTLSRSGDNQVLIGFSWASSFVLRGVELKLFNCETQSTNVHTINVWRSVVYPPFHSLAVTLVGSYASTGNDISCNSVTTVTISINTTSSYRNYFLEFAFPPGDSNTGVYIAEVQFSDTIIVPREISSSLSVHPQPSTTQKQISPTTSTQQQTSLSSLTPPQQTSVIYLTSHQQKQTASFDRSSSSTTLSILVTRPLTTPTHTTVKVTPPTNTTYMYVTAPLLTNTFTKHSPTQPADLPGNQQVNLSIVIGLLVSVIAILTLITVITTILWCRQKTKTREFTPDRSNNFSNNQESIMLKENQAYGNIDHGETVDTDPNPAYNSAHPPSSQQGAEYNYISDTVPRNQLAGNDNKDRNNSLRVASMLYEEIQS